MPALPAELPQRAWRMRSRSRLTDEEGHDGGRKRGRSESYRDHHSDWPWLRRSSPPCQSGEDRRSNWRASWSLPRLH
eukprot:8026790-Pyramimonas_sp.AAC.1